MRHSYIRFVSAETDDDSGALEGLFRASARVRDASDAPPHVVDELNEALNWFGSHLKAPIVYRPRGVDKRRAICWFKETSVEHVQRAQRLAQVVRRNGCDIRTIRTQTPGRVVWEDAHQVMAVPFRDTVMPRRRLAR
jgi:hypothetical protein